MEVLVEHPHICACRCNYRNFACQFVYDCSTMLGLINVRLVSSCSTWPSQAIRHEMLRTSGPLSSVGVMPFLDCFISALLDFPFSELRESRRSSLTMVAKLVDQDLADD